MEKNILFWCFVFLWLTVLTVLTVLTAADGDGSKTKKVEWVRKFWEWVEHHQEFPRDPSDASQWEWPSCSFVGDLNTLLDAVKRLCHDFGNCQRTKFTSNNVKDLNMLRCMYHHGPNMYLAKKPFIYEASKLWAFMWKWSGHHWRKCILWIWRLCCIVFQTQPSISGCVFRLRDQHGMGIIRGRLGAWAPPRGQQINLGEDISRQLGREEWFQNAE